MFRSIRAVVTDYDGTLTSTDRLAPEVVASLRALKAKGVKLILCTGRTLPKCYGRRGITDRSVIELFDLVVGDSGGIIWNPKTDEVRLLGKPVSPYLLKGLYDAGITPIEVSQTMVNIRIEGVPAVDRIAAELNISLGRVRGSSVQYVSPGICKSVGMKAALAMLGINPRNAVAIGDGTNDVDMLDRRRNGGALGVTVANGVPEAKRVADLVMKGRDGTGFSEMAAAVIRGQLGPDQHSLAA